MLEEKKAKIVLVAEEYYLCQAEMRACAGNALLRHVEASPSLKVDEKLSKVEDMTQHFLGQISVACIDSATWTATLKERFDLLGCFDTEEERGEVPHPVAPLLQQLSLHDMI